MLHPTRGLLVVHAFSVYLGGLFTMIAVMLLGTWMCHVFFVNAGDLAWLLMLSSHFDAFCVLSGDTFSGMAGCCSSWLVGVINSAILVSLALTLVVMCCIQLQACRLI